MVFIDTHCHLQMKTFKGEIKKILDNAARAGVKTIINVGFDMESSEEAVNLSKKYPCMYATVGIHPHDAKTYGDDSIAILESFLQEDKVVAIGEIGLDFYRNLSAPELQRTVFREQLEFAKDRDIPAVLHIRDAYGEVLSLLKETKPSKTVLHCFSGTTSNATNAVGMGCYLSFGGSITYGGAHLKDTVHSVPLSSMFLETDAPFLTPMPYRGKRNEPAFIRHTAERLAAEKDVMLEEIAEATTRNAQSFFGIK